MHATGCTRPPPLLTRSGRASLPTRAEEKENRMRIQHSKVETCRQLFVIGGDDLLYVFRQHVPCALA